MKKIINMDTERAEQLLEKYWMCETTVEEEEELSSFFTNDNVPQHLLKYKQLFIYRQEESDIALNEEFDNRILNIIRKEKKTVLRILRPWLQVAASVAVILTLWLSIRVYNENTDSLHQDTFQTPEQALAEMEKIFSRVSVQFEKTQELMSQQLEKTKPITEVIEAITE